MSTLGLPVIHSYYMLKIKLLLNLSVHTPLSGFVEANFDLSTKLVAECKYILVEREDISGKYQILKNCSSVKDVNNKPDPSAP